MNESEMHMQTEEEKLAEAIGAARQDLIRAAQTEPYNHAIRLEAQARFHDLLQELADARPHEKRELWYTQQRLEAYIAAGLTTEALEAIEDGLDITYHCREDEYEAFRQKRDELLGQSGT